MLYADTVVLPAGPVAGERPPGDDGLRHRSSRVAFLDDELSVDPMALPSSLKVRRGQTKWILNTERCSGTVADQIGSAAASSCGSASRCPEWLRGPLHSYLRETLRDTAASAPERGAAWRHARAVHR